MKNSINYFVISLPRTGTRSICKMAKICGLNPKHVPHAGYHRQIISSSYNFFADTPIFCPSVIKNICNNIDINSKFIYIEKDYKEIFDSWNKIKLYRNYTNFVKINSDKFDYKSYKEAFNNEILTENNYKLIFQKHKNTVFEILNNYHKEYLIYRFDQSWDPFCSFINKPIPKEPIPHLNINSMEDKI